MKLAKEKNKKKNCGVFGGNVYKKNVAKVSVKKPLTRWN